MSGEEDKVRALAAELARATMLEPHEKEALAGTSAFSDPNEVFLLLAGIELLGAKLHKQLVAWHSRYPARPSLAESDAFWTDLKELRAAKEELRVVLAFIKEREKTTPTLSSRINAATGEIGDVEKYFDTYLDRINPKND